MTTTMKKVEMNGTAALVEAGPVANTSIASVLDNAIKSNMSPEALEKIVALYERMSDRAAKAEFSAAMAHFKQTCPPIVKNTENTQFQVTLNGAKRNRRYASIQDIEATIRGPLGVCGLSFRWGDAKVEGNILHLSCIVSHVSGHSEASAVVLPVDSRAGCSEQQKYGSAMTYAQRYSLIQALGLTSCDEDNDGNEPGVGDEKITPEQAANLDAAIASAGGDKAKFLKWLGVEKLSDLSAGKLDSAHAAIERKRKSAGGVS